MASWSWTRNVVVLTALLVGAEGCKKKEEAVKIPPPGSHPNRGNVPATRTDETKLNDADITRAVRNGLVRDPGVDGEQISVKTSNGIVELTGKAGDILTRRRAVMIAEGVKGVRAVDDRLELVLKQRSDPEVQREVKNALLFNPATDSFEIDVKSDGAVVTLTGKVQSWQEKTLAERVAEGVRGVREVKNELAIDYQKPRSDAEIAADIRSRFRWDRLLSDGLLDVQVKDGKATLTGIVGSAAERRRAYGGAWVNGTKAVDDSAVEVRWWANEEDLRKHKVLTRPDNEIAEAIRDAAALDPRVESARLDVAVDSSTVTLKGSVDNAKARMVAEMLARNTVGAGRVKNELVIEPSKPISDAVIEDRVRSALLYDPLTDSYQIRANAKGGTVTLEGKVESTFERARANDTAAGVSGVKRVENRIELERPEIAWVYNWYLDPYDPYVETWHYVPAKPAKPDAEIVQQITEELIWSPFDDADEVKVSVAAGTATLTGTVDSRAEQSAAVENAFEGGAIAVENRLRVDPSG
jgi:osmotically-inducible protein OsmY